MGYTQRYMTTTNEGKAQERLAYTRREVAEMLGLSMSTVDRWLASGKLPSVKIGKRSRRIPAQALTDYLAGNPGENN